MESNSIVAETKALIQTCLADGKLDSGEVLKIGIFAAQQVNRLKGLTGVEKKALVLRAVEEAVNAVVPAEGPLREASKTALQVLPTVLDIAVSAANGRLALGKLKKSDLLGCLLGCFRVAAAAEPSAAPALAKVSQVVETVAKAVEPVAAPEPKAADAPEPKAADAPVPPAEPASDDDDSAPPAQPLPEESVPATPLTEQTTQEEETRPPLPASKGESPSVESEKAPSPVASPSKSP